MNHPLQLSTEFYLQGIYEGTCEQLDDSVSAAGTAMTGLATMEGYCSGTKIAVSSLYSKMCPLNALPIFYKYAHPCPTHPVKNYPDNPGKDVTLKNTKISIR